MILKLKNSWNYLFCPNKQITSKPRFRGLRKLQTLSSNYVLLVIFVDEFQFNSQAQQVIENI
ncbi:hypothetical protein AO265_40900 [Pseudomonas sp. ABAC61]|nr:hypothetical protein AO265_40900 [Pseudomonas sp. ABAC61]